MRKRGEKILLVDGREFVAGHRTGIGRFLEGLLLAIGSYHPEWKLKVLLREGCELPRSLEGVESIHLSAAGEVAFGRECSLLSTNADLFLSPYPKLPLSRLYCPTIHTVHDVFYLTHPTYRSNGLRTMVARWLLKRSIAKASLTWFVSHASQQACEALVGPTEHPAVRYSPIEPCFSPSASEQEESTSDTFLCVGNGMPHKNVELLLKAIEGTTLKLKCVGVSEQAEQRIVGSCPEVRDQVEFLRGVDDAELIKLYRDATALLLPSFEEGYGFPPLEAMACGTPAIVSDIPVLRESTGGKAIFCSPHDSEAWQRAMLRMQEPAHREAKRQEALAWIPCRQGQTGWQDHLSDMATLMESN
ncbi:MAG TPA: glycosyltransferase family 1 protein [Mariprofundaceae bacterium]|nr:glycosyltransferase family 1 protein [Mariprofundaceae bacterium]